MIETFARETQSGLVVQVLNYSNPGMHKGLLRRSYPIGAQEVGRVCQSEIQNYEVAALLTARPD